MSYSKPKQIQDGSLELSQTLLKSTLQRSAQREAVQQKRTSENLSSLTGIATTLASQSIAPKADGLAKLNEDYAKQTQKLYKKVGSSDYNINEVTDKKADVFMNGLIDDYYGIKNNIRNMKDPSLGMQDLGTIENMVDSYGKGVANMIAFNKAIEEASKADLNSGGKLSNAGAPSSQLQIIRKVTSGSEDIEYRREGNNIMLYDSKTKETLNITEFNAAVDRDEQYLVFAKPTEDLTTGFFGDIVKNDNDEGVYNPTFITTGPNDTYSMTPKQQEDYKNSLTNYDPSKPNEKTTGGSFEKLLNGGENIAESIWEDQMFEDPNYKAESQWPTGDQEIAIPYGDGFIKTELGSNEIISNGTRANASKEDKELYEAFYETYYKPSLDFLSEQSLRAGAASMQVKLDEPPEDGDDDASLLKDVNKQMSDSGNEPGPEEEKNPFKVDKGNNTSDEGGEEDEDSFISDTASTIFDYESKSGSSTGSGLKDFGFTDEKYKDKKYDKYRDEKGDLTKEGAQILFEKEYMSKVPSEYPKEIKQQLADYGFNSSMSTLDLMLLANGDLTLREARDEAEHGDLWKEKKESIEKLMQEDPAAFNEKLKQAKRDIYKDLDPKKYESTWKNRIDMFDVEKDNGDAVVDPAKKAAPDINDEADEVFTEEKQKSSDNPNNSKSEDTSYTTLMKPEEVKLVDRFTVENTGKGKANILRDGKPIISDKGRIKITGLRAEGNTVIVDGELLGIPGKGKLGSFDIVNGKAVFTEGERYKQLQGQDKIDFDTFKKAMELDIAYATKIQKQIQGEA